MTFGSCLTDYKFFSEFLGESPFTYVTSDSVVKIVHGNLPPSAIYIPFLSLKVNYLTCFVLVYF